jgi:hypothetical protein
MIGCVQDTALSTPGGAELIEAGGGLYTRFSRVPGVCCVSRVPLPLLLYYTYRTRDHFRERASSHEEGS